MPGVNDWLKKASSDLKASKKLSDDDETLDCSVFHTHQCAEKIFKAFIVFSKKPIPKTHDLRFLLLCCVEVDPEVMLLSDESKGLDAYGQDSRYPNDHFYVDKQCTEKAIEMAEKILITIKKKLNIRAQTKIIF
ncbi:HEPN domain-containing protein [Candidatus Babeliales bacterium]|nr:HEPN domain-containing protein [Candidatus Babeliales bacterium]